jgi:hypothetical protein
MFHELISRHRSIGLQGSQNLHDLTFNFDVLAESQTTRHEEIKQHIQTSTKSLAAQESVCQVISQESQVIKSYMTENVSIPIEAEFERIENWSQAASESSRSIEASLRSIDQ